MKFRFYSKREPLLHSLHDFVAMQPGKDSPGGEEGSLKDEVLTAGDNDGGLNNDLLTVAEPQEVKDGTNKSDGDDATQPQAHTKVGNTGQVPCAEG